MHFSSQNGNGYTTNLNEIKVNCYYEIFAVSVNIEYFTCKVNCWTNEFLFLVYSSTHKTVTF